MGYRRLSREDKGGRRSPDLVVEASRSDPLWKPFETCPVCDAPFDSFSGRREPDMRRSVWQGSSRIACSFLS